MAEFAAVKLARLLGRIDAAPAAVWTVANGLHRAANNLEPMWIHTTILPCDSADIELLHKFK